MFGAFLRAPAYMLFGWLVVEMVLGEVLTPMLDVMNGGSQQAKGSLLYDSLAAVQQDALLVVILSVLFGVLAAAVVESRINGGVVR
jgi:hypothetical protein